jgi:hypothetical protein
VAVNGYDAHGGGACVSVVVGCLDDELLGVAGVVVGVLAEVDLRPVTELLYAEQRNSE